MVRELRIQPREGQLLWVPQQFNVQDFTPRIDSLLSTLLPTVEVFGTEKMAEVQYAEVLGALGAVEVLHTAVAGGRCRIYLVMEYWHDDVVNRELRAGRVVPEATAGFPFVATTRSESLPGDTGGTGVNRRVVRNITVGPGARTGARADAMGGAARVTLRVHFIDFQLGAYVRSVS